jgi:transposase-like protein
VKIKDGLMKLVVKVNDVVALVKRFEASPATALRELSEHVRQGAKDILEQVMNSELELFLGQHQEAENKRNGYTTRTFVLKGIGALRLQVPRDRLGRFTSNVIPPNRRYDEALEKDLALLHLAGLSTRMLSQISKKILGLSISPGEVSNALKNIVPSAKAFLERDLSGRRFKYLWIDGTNFLVRRTTVEREPTLVVVGLDASDHKSVLAMIQGDKDARGAWEMVFARLKERGLSASDVELGIMDGLPGLADAFIEAFPKARVARCWIHKLRNTEPLVPRRYQAEYKHDWDKVAYAKGRIEAEGAFALLKQRWQVNAGDAVERIEKDLAALLCHYDFPREYWCALRSTNPIERVNKEFKRRSKAMEQMSADGLKVLLAFTALRLEFGWSTTPITSPKLANLKLAPSLQGHPSTSMDSVIQGLLN